MNKNYQTINAIVALCNGNGIGLNETIPWNIKEDLAYFKDKTTNCPVIMGRVTHDTLKSPLSNRINIVITSNKDSVKEGFIAVSSIVEAIDLAKSYSGENIWIIGGQSIYEQAMPYVQRLYITEIDQDLECDKFFPDFNYEDFTLTSSSVKDGYCFNVYDRKDYIEQKKQESKLFCQEVIARSFERKVCEERINDGDKRVIKAGVKFTIDGILYDYYKDITVKVLSVVKDKLRCESEEFEGTIVIHYGSTEKYNAPKLKVETVSDEAKVEAEAVKKPRKKKTKKDGESGFVAAV